MSNRRGSVIIYCIALASILVVLGYSFLRSTLADTTAGDASHKILLAQATARMGFMLATECIIGDYVQATQSVNQGAGGTTTIGAVTYLDGNWRAPFVSLVHPNEIFLVDHNTANEQDDVSAENFVLQPLVLWASGDEATRRHEWISGLGTMLYDGRGRYIEAGYHSTQRLAPAGPASRPTAELRFTDPAALVPDRAEGIFLDRNFHRIDSGDPAQDRIVARYRLRYAVGVEDLSGHLLSNPYAEGNFDPHSPTADYRNPPPVVAASQDAWYNMIQGIKSGLTTPLRYEHIFLGRGNTSNVDVDSANGGPVTFPRMFRQHIPNGGKAPYWGYFSYSPSGPVMETDGLYQPASAGGGEAIPAVGDNEHPIVAHGYGPQLSWFNQHYAADGVFYGGPSFESYPVMSSWEQDQFIPTPFGRRLQKSAAAPAAWKWYEGRVDTPWYVNLLTATPRTVHCMLLAYLPPAVKSVLLQSEQFILYTGTNARDHDTWDWNPVATNTASPGSPAQMFSRDLFTTTSGPAFSYAPPTADGVTPNFQRGDARSIEARYPGRLWNLNDNLGADIDIDSRLTIGACSHIGQPFFYGIYAEATHYQSEGAGWTTTPPPGWGQPRPVTGNPMYDGSKDLVRIVPVGGTQKYTFDQSYWWDLVNAFTTAIATTRAAWVQFPTRIFDPYVDMDLVLHDPSAFDTLEKIDRLFLRELGEDFDNPGNGVALTQVIYSGAWNNSAQQYRQTNATPNTIRMLVDQGLVTPDQANVMERVLNDMRMSFFGASPQYSETFRAKDFSGDGKVHCSAYDRNAVASISDEENGIAWWRAAVAGDGPVVDHWFSVTGCFSIGSSHYYRVFSRGAVWDNVIKKTIADQTLESVLCVDPEGDDPGNVRVLYQRWHFDRATAHLPRQTN